MTERVNHEGVFKIFVYVQMAEDTTSDSLVYLFECYVIYWGGSNGDIFRGEDLCGENLL